MYREDKWMLLCCLFGCAQNFAQYLKINQDALKIAARATADTATAAVSHLDDLSSPHVNYVSLRIFLSISSSSRPQSSGRARRPLTESNWTYHCMLHSSFFPTPSRPREDSSQLIWVTST